MSPLLGQAASAVGLDVGGTWIKAGTVAQGSQLRSIRRVPTPQDPSGRAVAAAIASLVTGLRAPATGTAIGVAVPGLVDEVNGVVVEASNLGWHQVPLRALIEEATECAVVIGHDVRAATAAELTHGAGRGLTDMVFLAVGTGVAAGLVIEGRIRSASGLAGEIGHLDTGHGLPCPCGATGCLEVIGSAAAIARRYSELTGRQVHGAADVARRATHGDETASRVWHDAVDALAQGISALAAVLGPSPTIIGGGLACAGAQLMDPLRAAVRSRLNPVRVPRLSTATFGDLAGVVGAAELSPSSKALA